MKRRKTCAPTKSKTNLGNKPKSSPLVANLNLKHLKNLQTPLVSRRTVTPAPTDRTIASRHQKIKSSPRSNSVPSKEIFETLDTLFEIKAKLNVAKVCCPLLNSLGSDGDQWNSVNSIFPIDSDPETDSEFFDKLIERKEGQCSELEPHIILPDVESKLDSLSTPDRNFEAGDDCDLKDKVEEFQNLERENLITEDNNSNKKEAEELSYNNIPGDSLEELTEPSVLETTNDSQSPKTETQVEENPAVIESTESTMKKSCMSASTFGSSDNDDCGCIPPPPIPAEYPIPAGVADGYFLCPGQSRDSVISALPLTDDCVMKDINDMQQKTHRIHDEIKQLRCDIQSLSDKEELSEADSNVLKEKQHLLMCRIGDLNEMTRKFERMMGLIDPKSETVAKTFGMLPYPHQAGSGSPCKSPCDSPKKSPCKTEQPCVPPEPNPCCQPKPMVGICPTAQCDDDKFDVFKIEYPEEKIPRIIVCGNTDEKIPRIVVADSQPKQKTFKCPKTPTPVECFGNTSPKRCRGLEPESPKPPCCDKSPRKRCGGGGEFFATGQNNETPSFWETYKAQEFKEQSIYGQKSPIRNFESRINSEFSESGKTTVSKLYPQDEFEELHRKVFNLQTEVRTVVKENCQFQIADNPSARTSSSGPGSRPQSRQNPFYPTKSASPFPGHCSGTDRLAGGASQCFENLENSFTINRSKESFQRRSPAIIPDRTSSPSVLHNFANGLGFEKKFNFLGNNNNFLNQQLSSIEDEVRVLQNELSSLQKERQQMEQVRRQPVESVYRIAGGGNGRPNSRGNKWQRDGSDSQDSNPQQQLRDLKEQYNRLQEDYKSKLYEVSKLRSDSENLKRDSREAKEDRERLEIKLIDAQERLKNVEKERDELLGCREQIVEQEQALLVAKQRFRDSQDELEELRTMIRDQAKQLDDYRSKYLQAQQQVEEYRRQTDLMEMDNARINENVTLEIGRVKNQFQEKLAELAPLPDLLKQTQLKLQDAQQTRMLAERNLEDLSREFLSAKDRIDSLALQNENLQRELQSLQEEQSGSDTKSEELEKKVSELRNENERLKNSILRAEEQQAVLQKRIDEKQHEITQLNAMLEQIREDSARQVARTKERSEALKRSMQAEISNFEVQLAQCRAAANTAQKERDEIRQKMQNQINNLNEAFDQAQARIKSLQGHVQYLKVSYSNVFSNPVEPQNPILQSNNQGYDSCDCNY